jgi:hypothetical protein
VAKLVTENGNFLPPCRIESRPNDYSMSAAEFGVNFWPGMRKFTGFRREEALSQGFGRESTQFGGSR